MRMTVSKVKPGYRGRSTDCSLLGYDMNDIRHEAEALQPFSAPIDDNCSGLSVLSGGNCDDNATHKLDGDRLRIEKIGS